MNVSRTLSEVDRAEQILRQFFIPAVDDSVSRRNALNQLGGTGHVNIPHRRSWALAWHLLSRAGFICPEPEYPKDGDIWFLTPSGRVAMNTDFAGSLQMALGRL